MNDNEKQKYEYRVRYIPDVEFLSDWDVSDMAASGWRLKFVAPVRGVGLQLIYEREIDSG